MVTCRRALNLDKRTFLFNNPKDLVPSLPLGFLQTKAAAVFNPVNDVKASCPFIGSKKSRVYNFAAWLGPGTVSMAADEVKAAALQKIWCVSIHTSSGD